MDQGFLNAGLVEIFLIENPGFLDEFVKVHVTKDRIQAWLDTKLLAEAALEDMISYSHLHQPPTTTATLPRPMERVIARTLERPLERPIERGLEPNFERPMERPIDRGMARPIERAFEKALDPQRLENAIERVVVPPIESTIPPVTTTEIKAQTKKRNSAQRGKRIVGLKQHRCQECNKDFESESKLQRHLRVHTGQRPFVCNLCGKSFTQSNNLKEHITIHNENRELYKCEECDKNFTRKRHLQRHQQIHSGVMRFQCNLCDKRFNYKYSLNIHHNVHTGEKKFRCDVCDKRFTEPSNLKRHIRTHTKEKTKQCDYCDKSFVSTSDLKRHRLTHEKSPDKDGKAKKQRSPRKRRSEEDRVDVVDKEGMEEEEANIPQKQKQRRKRKPRQGLKLSDLNEQAQGDFFETAQDKEETRQESGMNKISESVMEDGRVLTNIVSDPVCAIVAPSQPTVNL